MTFQFVPEDGNKAYDELPEWIQEPINNSGRMHYLYRYRRGRRKQQNRRIIWMGYPFGRVTMVKHTPAQISDWIRYEINEKLWESVK